MSQPTPDILAQYTALTTGAGFANLSSRTQIEFTGADRASFLHNLCTNEIKKLPVGSGCETFITNVQGRTIGHGYVYCRTDSLVFDTVPGQGEFLFRHFDKYHVREKVEIHDRSATWSELLLTQPPPGMVSSSALPLSRLLAYPMAIADVLLAEHPVSLRRVGLVAPDTYVLSAAAEVVAALSTYLLTSGLLECSPDAVEMARLESGTPLFGQDITDKNLPQEVARDKQAISFTKGCYLGQETVARIDALGHVNQRIVGVRFSSDTVPIPGTELASGEKTVGHVTSAAWSPRLSAPLALAYVRREHAASGTKLGSRCGEAEVISLPILA